MILKNANIHTMEGLIINNGYVKIEEKIIKKIGTMQDFHYIGDDEIDLCGADLYPGFIDAHSHIGLLEDSMGFEGEDINETSDPITPHLRAIDGINPLDRCFSEALMSGVTTVAVSPGSANPIAGQICTMKTLGKRVDDMIIKDPVAIKFALGENPKFTYKEKTEAPLTRMSIVALITEQLKKTQVYLQSKNLYLEDPSNYTEPEYDIKCEALIPLLKGEIKGHFHAHRADDIFTAIRISKQFHIDCCIVHATQGHIICDELCKDNPYILSGPILSERCKPELSGLTPESSGIMMSAGLNVSIITDHSVIPEQYLLLCVSLAVRDGMDREKAIETITINPAKCLGIDDKVGSIKEGKEADFVAFKGDLLNIMNKPILVMCNGKVALK